MATSPIFDDVKPWPGEGPKPATATIGHNKPPAEDDVRAQFREQLLTAKPDFDTRLEQIEAASGRVEVTNDETLGRAGDMIRIIRATDKLVSDTHVQVKAPYLAAGRVVDAEKNALTGRLAAARGKVEGQMNAYADEQRRLAREAAAKADEERRRLEELARENQLETALPPAPPPPSRPDPIRSDGGATVSIGTEWCCEIEDATKAFRHVKNDAAVIEAIQKALTRHVRATKGNNGKPLAGVRMFERAKTTAR